MTENSILIPKSIIRTKRKSLSLQIKNNGDLIVRAPLNYKDYQIFDFIKKKSNWIIEKRTLALNNMQKPMSIENNETINLLDKTYIITLTSNKTVKIIGNILYVPIIEKEHKLKLFIKRFAKKVITEKVNYYAKQNNLSFTSISISSAKTNWGSCNGKNKLHFTYKLMLCPNDIVDYIVVHELAHTVIKNHSSKFWNLVKMFYPNYKVCEKWLKDNKSIVEII